MKLKRNILFVGIQTIIQAIIYLILYRYLLIFIGVEKIGIWSIVLATTSSARVSEMGLGGSITKYIATYQSKKQYKEASESLQTAGITLFFAIAIILLLLYPLLENLLVYFLPKSGINDGVEILPYALLSLWISSTANIWLNGLDGCLRSDLRAMLVVVGSLVLLISSIILVKPYGLVGLAFAQLLQAVWLFFAGWFVIKSTIKKLPLFPYQWKFPRLKEMLGYGVNFQINSIIGMLFDPTAKILLGKFGDLSTVGYFEMAQRFVTMTRNLIIQSNKVIVPVFASIDNSKVDEHDKLYKINLRYLFVILTLLFAVLLGAVSVVSELWLGEYQLKFITIASALTIAWYLNSVTAPAYFAYLGQGKLFWVTVSHVSMGLINLLLGYYLGGLFGWQGVIFSFCLALVIGSFIPAWTYQKNTDLSINQIFSKYDVILFFISFSSAFIVLFNYQLMLEFNIWLRVGIVMSWLFISSFLAFWLHPIRKKILEIIGNK